MHFVVLLFIHDVCTDFFHIKCEILLIDFWKTYEWIVSELGMNINELWKNKLVF